VAALHRLPYFAAQRLMSAQTGVRLCITLRPLPLGEGWGEGVAE